MLSKSAKTILIAAMLLLGLGSASAMDEGLRAQFAKGRRLQNHPILDALRHAGPHREGGGAGHKIAQAVGLAGAVGAVAGLGTEAYGLATGDKNAQGIGAAELGVGGAAALGGGGAAVASRCKWAVGNWVSNKDCKRP